MRIRRLLPLISVVFAAACERVVDLTVPEGPRLLVVEARLEHVLGSASGTQTIRLTTTSGYFSNAAPPPARGARVRVVDDAGTETLFAESPTPGVYTTTALPVQRGRTYTLLIEYAGEQFEAIESTRTVAPIESLYFDKPKPGRFSGDEGVRATIDFTDPAGERNYYLWDQYVNGVRQLGPDTAFKLRIIAQDNALNGIAVVGFQPYEGIDVPVGSTVLVRQIGLSEAMFRYYFALSDQVGVDGSPFAVPPASVRGNVINRTTRDRPALGYFYVSEVSEARATRR